MLADLEDDGRGAGGRKAPRPPADARASRRDCGGERLHAVSGRPVLRALVRLARHLRLGADAAAGGGRGLSAVAVHRPHGRSDEHTSNPVTTAHLVCRLLLGNKTAYLTDSPDRAAGAHT